MRLRHIARRHAAPSDEVRRRALVVKDERRPFAPRALHRGVVVGAGRRELDRAVVGVRDVGPRDAVDRERVPTNLGEEVEEGVPVTPDIAVEVAVLGVALERAVGVVPPQRDRVRPLPPKLGHGDRLARVAHVRVDQEHDCPVVKHQRGGVLVAKVPTVDMDPGGGRGPRPIERGRRVDYMRRVARDGPRTAPSRVVRRGGCRGAGRVRTPRTRASLGVGTDDRRRGTATGTADGSGACSQVEVAVPCAVSRPSWPFVVEQLSMFGGGAPVPPMCQMW